MVKLTTKFLFRKISKKNQLQPRHKDESDLDYLKRLTHLHLQSQFIEKISPIPECQSVSVLYLQHNLLRTLQNMESFPNLTHLYLQHNFITKIENLNNLVWLKKLYLGNNEISVVEGLEGLKNLVELHLESQRLPQGETLYFDPSTLFQLGNTLKVLNISNNNIVSIRCLSDIASLTTLLVENNLLEDLDDVMETLYRLPRLETFNSEGNPVASDRKYLDHVIIASRSLKNLNGKKIDERTRVFVTNLAYNRECRRKLSRLSTQVFNSSESCQEPREEARRSLGHIVSKSSSRLGSKLFPVLKKMTESKGSPLISHSFASSKEVSSGLGTTLNVSRVPDPRRHLYRF